MRAKLIIFERKFRILLYSFCAYTLLFSTVSVVFKEPENIVNNPIFIILAGLFSLAGGLVIDEEIESIKKEYEWDWKPKTRWDYYCTEWVGLVTIGLLYFMVQMGLGAIFFPGFDKIKFLGERYLYTYLFTFNSIIIYILYRLTIIKIEFQNDKEVSED